MARSWDEPFTLYGLLAESVETPDDRSWVEFTLRPEARFSDGTPVTVEDVIFSLTLLGEEGHGRYRRNWPAVASMEQTGPRSLRITFGEPNRELPLIMGLRPILKKAEWEGRDFEASGLTPWIGSGPYVIGDFESGRFIELRRNPDYWAQDLPARKGLYNFDVIRFQYYGDSSAAWQAFVTGEVTFRPESDTVRWAEGYDIPQIADGTIRRRAFAHGRPSGMRGFVFNTRRAIFADRRVREALTLALDWEWVNRSILGNAYARITSYWSNSPFAFDGRAEGREREILAPYDLPAGTLDAPWTPPVGAGDGRNRRNLRAAARLLDAAGWQVVDGRRVNAAGEVLAFEIMVASGDDAKIAALYAEMVRPLGVTVTVRETESLEFTRRLDAYDYDMVPYRWSMSLSPGTEQKNYFLTDLDQPGTRNYMGVAEPALEATVAAMLNARTEDDFRAAVRAHDRVLTSGIYVLPFGFIPEDRVAWHRGLGFPDAIPLYGYRIEAWFAEPE